MPIAEVHMPITLDKKRTLIFNLNTMSAYEQASGKFYFDTIMTMYDLYNAAKEKIAEEISRRSKEKVDPDAIDVKKAVEGDPKLRVKTVEIIRRVPIADMHCLIWAALHEYPNGSDDPYWPMTKSQVGRYFNPINIIPTITLLLQGHAQNAPNEKELGEVVTATKSVNGGVAEVVPMRPESGGEPSTEFREEDFG